MGDGLRFKVGDRVRFVGPGNALNACVKVGQVGRVRAVDCAYVTATVTRSDTVCVDWDGKIVQWVLPGELERVDESRAADAAATHTLPVESERRKDFPMHRGLLRYFPAALAGVAWVSKLGNDKHNPGQPMHHARGKSTDHADCIVRHQLDLDADYGRGVGRDEAGVPQVLYTAWRALAQAQEWLERHDGAPKAPAAVMSGESPVEE